MNELNVPSPSNGIRQYWEDLEYLLGYNSVDGGIINALTSLLRVYGDNYIVYGCGVAGTAVSAGWIMLDGELIKVDAHTKTNSYFVKVVGTNTDGDREDGSANNVNIYTHNRATITAGSGNLIFTANTLDDLINDRLLNSNNLSDLSSAATGRTNLSVYSKSEVISQSVGNGDITFASTGNSNQIENFSAENFTGIEINYAGLDLLTDLRLLIGTAASNINKTIFVSIKNMDTSNAPPVSPSPAFKVRESSGGSDLYTLSIGDLYTNLLLMFRSDGTTWHVSTLVSQSS